MLKLEPDKMQKAIERAKAVHPKVRVIDADNREYAVTGSRGDVYRVRFVVANGHKLGECECVAGRRGHLCYHICAAAAVNMGVQSMRRQARLVATPVATPVATSAMSSVERMEAFYHRNCGWMV